MSSQRGEWICASCGTRVKTNDAPCPNCAGETFAKLEDNDPPVERAESVVWVCEHCGETSPRNETPCRNCGGFDYRKRVETAPEPDRVDVEADAATDANARTITLRWLAAYAFGAWALLSLVGAIIIGSIPSMLLHATAASVAMPVTRRRLENWSGIQLSGPAVAAIAVFALLAGNTVILIT